MSLTCQHCGKPLATTSTGRPKAYCDDRCRNAAREARAAKQDGDVQTPAPAPETRQRGLYTGRDFGDGDPCPQDAGHGRLFFMKPAMARQWCCHSAHRGDSFYARDGVTPAPRPAPADPAPSAGGHHRQPDQLLTEASSISVASSSDAVPAGLARGASPQLPLFGASAT